MSRVSNLRLLSFVVVGAVTSSVSHAETLKVCYDQWPPMTIFPTKAVPERGVVIDMVEQIYSSKGYSLEYYEVPLARGVDMVAEGICDLLPEYLYSKNPDMALFMRMKQHSHILLPLWSGEMIRGAIKGFNP